MSEGQKRSEKNKGKNNPMSKENIEKRRLKKLAKELEQQTTISTKRIEK